jgi:hypothetical protein
MTDMAFAFDTLGYSKHLQGAGVEAKVADAHAEAARDYVMTELVTKTDLNLALENVKTSLTVRLGSIMVAGIAALAVLERLH